MTSAVAATFGVTQKLIAQLGDRQLPTGLEPLNVVPGAGSAAVSLTSQKDQRLTFGIIGAAMQVSRDFLVFSWDDVCPDGFFRAVRSGVAEGGS